MSPKYEDIQEIIRRRADLNARLKLLPYDGTPEVKTRGDKKYLYVRKRELGKQKSSYVGVYSDELYNILLSNAREAREIKKELRALDKELVSLGYEEASLSSNVLMNIDFARVNMKTNIYDQAVLEGVGTTFPQTEEIIDNGKVSGVKASDVQKILNLKHAWEFILDNDVITCKSDYYLLTQIANLVNEGFYIDGGRMRSLPVEIGGSSYLPPIPMEADVKDDINSITSEDALAIDIAIKLCLYTMKKQIFLDGNKRSAIIFANHYLIGHAGGFLVIPENEVEEFKKLLVDYYEGEDLRIISEFMKEKSWKKLE